MLKKLLKSLAVPPIETAARDAWKAGDTIFVRTFHPRPGKNDTDLAEAVQAVTEIGWTLASSQFEGSGLQRHANLVFTRS
ncbi:hypothetical protein [Streptomyces erythrochromogenes]|uniref:hypothetical protein n=1 Tax=Streptomyces erythrochromogenes TaxID=285574 RepID=UPI0038707FBC|nr:hypothetical protein OG489_00400 [Streptomyces erythrochromogenes]WSR88288.1 hypothetical protein OG489_39560 [Streptomyces erythrochromogenes]